MNEQFNSVLPSHYTRVTEYKYIQHIAAVQEKDKVHMTGGKELGNEGERTSSAWRKTMTFFKMFKVQLQSIFLTIEYDDGDIGSYGFAYGRSTTKAELHNEQSLS